MPEPWIILRVTNNQSDITSTRMYCLTAACKEVKYEAFDCGRDRKSENFPEEYCMIDCVKCFRVVNQEASDVST